MSYDVQLFRKEVKQKHFANPTPEFFENENNFVAFTPEQKTYLTNYLVKCGYVIEKEEPSTTEFSHEDEQSVSALLTDYAIYFSASGDGIFEISMTASEITSNGEYVKFDPQNDGWEEID